MSAAEQFWSSLSPQTDDKDEEFVPMDNFQEAMIEKFPDYDPAAICRLVETIVCRQKCNDSQRVSGKAFSDFVTMFGSLEKSTELSFRNFFAPDGFPHRWFVSSHPDLCVRITKGNQASVGSRLQAFMPLNSLMVRFHTSASWINEEDISAVVLIYHRSRPERNNPNASKARLLPIKCNLTDFTWKIADPNYTRYPMKTCATLPELVEHIHQTRKFEPMDIGIYAELDQDTKSYIGTNYENDADRFLSLEIDRFAKGSSGQSEWKAARDAGYKEVGNKYENVFPYKEDLYADSKSGGNYAGSGVGNYADTHVNGPTGSYGGAGPAGSYGGAGPAGSYGGAGPAGSYGGAGPAGSYGGAGPAGSYGGAGPEGNYGSQNHGGGPGGNYA